ncbi:FAD-dependent oxidoreductase [Sphingomonas arenae]|uniref:FAD-dependent oxidoreductase n=1 Tax=Sphingomonas arenae TaxID=2812555 RepID=UPI0030135E8D
MIESPLARRTLLRSAALTGAALALPGCATVSIRRTVQATCLPPVNVDPSRVIRTVAGLRPYRASGFVVRAEPLGSKRLVHNYGHGGAGITLSWGSARLATQLGLQGHAGPVAVIGAGALGLSTARLVQEAGFPVTLYTAQLPPETTSNIAGGQISPFGHYREGSVTPEWQQQFLSAMEYSWRRFQLLVGDDYGIRWLTTYTQGHGDPDPTDPLHRFHPASRTLTSAQHPFALDGMASYDTMYVETGRYLRQLTRDILQAGGKLEVRRFATPADIATLPEPLIFNCTGLGSRELFGDTELQPVRGQLAILLPQPEIRYAFTGDAGYMFPRPDGIILGGTFERGQSSTIPEAAAIARILQTHRQVFSSFRCVA